MTEKRKYADRRDEMIKAVTKRRKKIKFLAIEYLGGKCQICGYDKYQGSFDIHHLDRENKDFGIGSKGYTRSWKRVKSELDKCILLCANCHREVEAKITQLPEETQVEKRGEFGEAQANSTCQYCGTVFELKSRK